MRHPYAWLQESAYKALAKRLLILFIPVSVTMAILDSYLKSPEVAPLGILSLQFATSVDQVRNLFSKWTGQSQVVLCVSLGLDYLYMITYGALFSLGCSMGGLKLPQFRTLGFGLAWGMIWAALLDMVENAACIYALMHEPTTLSTQITYICATLKFSIILFALMFIAFSGLSTKQAVRKP